MKKLVYSLLVLCSACLLAWACNSMDESVAVTDLEESLNLQAPSGMKIANSMLDLKEFLGKDMDFPMDEFEITDIYKTSVCPLAKVMRKELKARGIENLKVLYSKERPIIPYKNSKERNIEVKEKANIYNENDKSEVINDSKKQIPGSISFVPTVAGLIIAGEVIKDIIGYNKL